jgi:hypothetical protein
MADIRRCSRPVYWLLAAAAAANGGVSINKPAEISQLRVAVHDVVDLNRCVICHGWSDVGRHLATEWNRKRRRNTEQVRVELMLKCQLRDADARTSPLPQMRRT